MLEEKIRLYQLMKQNLIEKISRNNYLDFLKKIIGLHSTDYLTPYFSLYARVQDFCAKDLFDDLNKNYNALRMRGLRGTVFVVHRENIGLIIVATKNKREDWMKDVYKYVREGIDFDVIEKEVVKLLQGKNHYQISQIKKKLKEKIPTEDISTGLNYLEFKGVAIRSFQRYITDNLYHYGLLEEWFPEESLKANNYEESYPLMMEKYIEAFGPTTLDDYSWWLPDKKTPIKEAYDKISHKFEQLKVNSLKYLIHKNEIDSFNNFNHNEIEKPIVNFLPYEDHFPKGFKNRENFIDNDAQQNLFGVRGLDKGEIRPSIWLNGEVVGRWEYSWTNKEKIKMKIEIPYLNEKKVNCNKTKEIIESKRNELEDFTNSQIVPLINSK
ncbi:MAG: DNA glycosylase AlkZ-like family protein, partial [Candidatus Thorarchaeota archaeon]